MLLIACGAAGGLVIVIIACIVLCLYCICKRNKGTYICMYVFAVQYIMYILSSVSVCFIQLHS